MVLCPTLFVSTRQHAHSFSARPPWPSARYFRPPGTTSAPDRWTHGFWFSLVDVCDLVFQESIGERSSRARGGRGPARKRIRLDSSDVADLCVYGDSGAACCAQPAVAQAAG